MESSSLGSGTLSCLLPLKFWVSGSEKLSWYWSSGLESTWSCFQDFVFSVPFSWNAGPLDLYGPCCLLINSFRYLIFRYQRKDYLPCSFPCLLRCPPHHTLSHCSISFTLFNLCFETLFIICQSPLDHKFSESSDCLFIPVL